jgi:MraZ protein
MLIGQYKYSLDSKRRLAVPADFRKYLGKKAVITKGLDNCLFLYSVEEWKQSAEKLSKLPITQSDARGFSRTMLAGAMEVSFDSLGRILVPEYLTQYAGMKKTVIFAGLYNRIEIWSQEKWQQYKEKTEKQVDKIAERLKELNI